MGMSYWYRRVFLLAIPLILSNLTQPLLSMVDTILSGHLPGPAALGGVAVGGIFFNSIYWTFGFLRMATTGLVAQSQGGGDQDQVMHHFGRALLTALLIGALLLVVQRPLISAALALLGASSEVHRNALIYCSIRIWSAPAALANYTILGYFLGRQFARTALLLQAGINLVNMVLALTLVLWRHWGVAGIATATMTAEWTGCILGFALMLATGARPSQVRWSELVDGGSLRRLFALNRDILLRTLSLVAAYAWFTRTGARSGNAILAANAVLINFLWIAGYGLDGFANATEALVGEAIGARSVADFRAVLKASSVSAFTVAAAISLLYLVFGRSIIALFTNQEAIRSLAAQLSSLADRLAFSGGVELPAGWRFHRRHTRPGAARQHGHLPRRIPRLGRWAHGSLRQSRPVVRHAGLHGSAGDHAGPAPARNRTKILHHRRRSGPGIGWPSEHAGFIRFQPRRATVDVWSSGGGAMSTRQPFDLVAAARRSLTEHGFAPDYPAPVERELAALQTQPPQINPAAEDLRHLLWSSIDNDTSRDLDQIEYADTLPDGRTRVRIGIADVARYVPQGSAMDQFAAQQTVTLYTGVKNFSMLPEALSTGLTSLLEQEDRACMVTEFVLDANVCATESCVSSSRIYPALVRNKAQLAYNSVGAWLDGKAEAPVKVTSSAELQTQLKIQNQIAQRLRAERYKHGALNIETMEGQAVVQGDEIKLQTQAKNSATELIEDLMIAANGVVARTLQEKNIASIRRIVRTPKRWDRIVELAAGLGTSCRPPRIRRH